MGHLEQSAVSGNLPPPLGDFSFRVWGVGFKRVVRIGSCHPRELLPWNVRGHSAQNSGVPHGQADMQGLRQAPGRGHPQACGQLSLSHPPICSFGLFPGQGRFLGTLGELLCDKQETEGKGGGEEALVLLPAQPPKVRWPVSWLVRGVAERGLSLRAPPLQSWVLASGGWRRPPRGAWAGSMCLRGP